MFVSSTVYEKIKQEKAKIVFHLRCMSVLKDTALEYFPYDCYTITNKELKEIKERRHNCPRLMLAELALKNNNII